jgi:hypothetical protein
MPYSFTLEEENLRRLLFKPCENIQELHDWVYVYCDVDLPGCHVDPDSTGSPLEMCYETYDLLVNGGPENVSRVLYYASRGGFKTLVESIVEVLLLLHFRSNVIHLSAIEEQSKNCQEYLKNFFAFPALRGFVEGDNKRATSTVFYEPIDKTALNLTKAEWKTLPWEEQQQYRLVTNKVEVIVATMKSTNGKHGVMFLDELDIIDSPRVLKQTVNIPTPCRRANGKVALPITVLTSTRKTSHGPVQDAINKADKTGLLIRHWNAIDVTEKCPGSRHRPDLPHLTVYRSDELVSAITEENYSALPKKDQESYVKDECYHGCLKNCSLFAACKGNLATKQTSTSKLLKPISFQINQFKDNELDTVQSELLCRKPSSEGLVYPRLDKAKHVLTPAQAYEKISGEKCSKANFSKAELVEWLMGKGEWCGALDWGWTHYFAYCQGIDINNTMYITHAFAGAELERSQQLEEMEQFRRFEPTIWPDKEDPLAVREFKKAGFRLKDWNKNQGSVVGGINIVRKKLSPTLGRPPELYFVRDLGSDPHIDLLFQHVSEHHWKLGATGEPTNQVSDTNKDLPDSLRYLVMNKYSDKGQFAISNEAEPKDTIRSQDGQPVYSAETWMSQKIAELTGGEVRPVQTSRPPMVVEEIGKSYYSQVNEKEKKDRTGTRRGIIWDFD